MHHSFRGVYAVSCTPFDADGNFDEKALRRHVRCLLDEADVHGLISAGITGGFAFLSPAGREAVIATVIDEPASPEQRRQLAEILDSIHA